MKEIRLGLSLNNQYFIIQMNDQRIKSENSFLGSITIIIITIVTGMLFIPELQAISDDYLVEEIDDKKYITKTATLDIISSQFQSE